MQKPAAGLNSRFRNVSVCFAWLTIATKLKAKLVYIFDARVTKTFKFGENYSVSILGEAFNLFNRSNLATVNTGRYGIASNSALVLTNPAATTPFGGPRTFLGERQIQLGLRFRF